MGIFERPPQADVLARPEAEAHRGGLRVGPPSERQVRASFTARRLHPETIP